MPLDTFLYICLHVVLLLFFKWSFYTMCSVMSIFSVNSRPWRSSVSVETARPHAVSLQIGLCTKTLCRFLHLPREGCLDCFLLFFPFPSFLFLFSILNKKAINILTQCLFPVRVFLLDVIKLYTFFLIPSEIKNPFLSIF